MTRDYRVFLLCSLGWLVGCESAGESDHESDFAGSAAASHVLESPLVLTVNGETATGLVFEPYREDPGDTAPAHLITYCHGHGEQAVNQRDTLIALARATGALIVGMDYRNAPGNEPGDFSVMRGYQDTVAATRWALENYPSLKTSDIWGWSMGGFVSGMAVAYDSDLYRYWVATFPGVNAVEAWMAFSALKVLGTNDAVTELENDAGCSFAECPDEYVARSPSLLAGMMNPERAIILHGVLDGTSPYQQGREMFSTLVANGVPVTMYSFLTQDNDGTPGPAGHSRFVYEESVVVLKRLLAGEEPTALSVYEYWIDENLGLHAGPLPPL